MHSKFLTVQLSNCSQFFSVIYIYSYIWLYTVHIMQIVRGGKLMVSADWFVTTKLFQWNIVLLIMIIKKQYKTGRRQFQYDIESCTSIHVILHVGRIHVIYCLAFNLAQILYSSYTTPTHLMNSKHIIWEHGLLLHLVCKHLQLSPSSLELKH